MTAIGIGLVGSISGTVAWYQYSTRVQAAFAGTSVAGNNKNMQIKVNDGEWKEEYTIDELAAAIENKNSLKPVTTADQKKDTALGTLYNAPVYQYGDYASWGTATANVDYVQFTLSFRVKKVDGSNVATYVDKDLFLTNITFRDATVGLGLSEAVRVHLATTDTKALFSKSTASLNVYGPLDLNNDGYLDKAVGYEWDEPEQLTYGTDGAKQEAYLYNDGAIVANEATAELSGGKSFGKTGTSAAGLSMTVTIFLEGFQKMATGEDENAETSNTAVWKAATYVGKTLQVGMRFGVSAED